LTVSSKSRLVVLVSGAGTNLQALLDACASDSYGAQVVGVGADRDHIAALARAEAADPDDYAPGARFPGAR
jgi:phosphoribosylglycinamide formyltransferase-1